MKHHPETPIEYISDVREIDTGEYEGRPLTELLDARKKSEIAPVKFKGKRDESFMDVIARIKNFYETLRQKHICETIVVVAHGGSICMLLSDLTGEQGDDLNKKYFFNNTGVAELLVTPTDEQILYYNCTKHLD